MKINKNNLILWGRIQDSRAGKLVTVQRYTCEPIIFICFWVGPFWLELLHTGGRKSVFLWKLQQRWKNLKRQVTFLVNHRVFMLRRKYEEYGDIPGESWSVTAKVWVLGDRDVNDNRGLIFHAAYIQPEHNSGPGRSFVSPPYYTTRQLIKGVRVVTITQRGGLDI